MFGPLGVWEIAFIMVLALLIFGPKKLPEVGRTIGRGMAEFRKATTDLKKTIETEIDLEERRPAPVKRPQRLAAAPELSETQPPRSDTASESEPADPSGDAAGEGATPVENAS